MNVDLRKVNQGQKAASLLIVQEEKQKSWKEYEMEQRETKQLTVCTP